MEDFIAQEQAELFAAKGLAGDAHEFSLSNSSVHVDVPLTNLAMAITNRDFIADSVMPVVRVQKDSNKYFKYDPDTYYEEQETLLLGSEATPGRIRYKISTGSYSCQDYGLMDFVSQKEIQNADAPIDPLKSATRILKNRLMLARERRVAAKVFNASNYGSNTAALSGSSQWDNASSDPVQAILDAIEACYVRPNVMVIGAQVWQKLQNNAKMTALVYNRAATSLGPTPLRPTLATLAAAFELDAVYVGRSLYNTNREGQTSAKGYVWGKSCALIKVTDTPDPRETNTFGYTFRSEEMQVQLIEDQKPGRSGGVWVKQTHADDENIVAGQYAGYLYTAAVS